MVSQIVAILALILGKDHLQGFYVIGQVALWVVVVTALVSAADYFRRQARDIGVVELPRGVFAPPQRRLHRGACRRRRLEHLQCELQGNGLGLRILRPPGGSGCRRREAPPRRNGCTTSGSGSESRERQDEYGPQPGAV